MANVVLLRETPSRSDIAEQMRALADRIAAGEFDASQSAIVILAREGDDPQVWQWGDVGGELHPIVQCHLAINWFARMRVTRA